jgi:SPP1 family predicted phage head-tail adaptor
MRAGKLRHRVRIEQEITTRRPSGDELITWSTVATVWAEVQPVSGRESALAEQTRLEALVDHKIRVRYRPGISVQMRVVWPERNRTFNVVSVLEMQAAHELVLRCTEVQA